MFLNNLTFALLTVGVIASHQVKRFTQSDVTIYAYGEGISGLPVLADSSGIAYVSTATVQPTSLSSCTWTISTTGTSAWTVSFNSTNSTTATNGTFYIIPTSGSYEPVGFITNNTAPTGAVTTPFLTYGEQIQYKAGSVLEAQFWAMPIENTDQYSIMWNSNGTNQVGSTPVVLKTTAPHS